MTDSKNEELMKRLLDRRKFLAATALTGSSLLFASRGSAQEAATTGTAAAAAAPTGPKPDALKCGIIGVGSQGRVLINAALKVPDIRFVAVADCWEDSRNYASGILKKFG